VSRGIGNAAGVDLHSRLKLDGMWFRDGRNNLDAEAQVEAFLVGILGPTVGLLPTAARAVDLYKTGHADRAIETMLPGFAKQPVIAASCIHPVSLCTAVQNRCRLQVTARARRRQERLGR